MKLKSLSIAIIVATLPTTGVFAAALDRSGQSISAFLTLEARKGHFSLAAADEPSMRLGSTALLVTKH